MILQTETLHNINWKIWYPYERLPIGSGAFWENHCVRPAWAICPPEQRQVFLGKKKRQREKGLKKFLNLLIFSAVSFLLESASRSTHTV